MHPPSIKPDSSQIYGFFVPYINSGSQDLDGLLVSFGVLWKTGNDLITRPRGDPNEFRTLLQDALRLDQKITAWSNHQLESFRPRKVGSITRSNARPDPPAGYWPGRVDTYFDLYVAGVWNTYRTVRCLLLSLISNLSSMSSDDTELQNYHKQALGLVEDVIASVPYHLTHDLHAFLDNVEHSGDIADPGRIVGGLFLMQTLYVLSRLAVVPAGTRAYMKNCLTWIGTNMGIGQAFLYAQVSYQIRSRASIH